MKDTMDDWIDTYPQDCLLTDLSWLDHYDIPVKDTTDIDDLKIVSFSGLNTQYNVYDYVNNYVFVGDIGGYFDGDDFIYKQFEIWCKPDKVINYRSF